MHFCRTSCVFAFSDSAGNETALSGFCPPYFPSLIWLRHVSHQKGSGHGVKVAGSFLLLTVIFDCSFGAGFSYAGKLASPSTIVLLSVMSAHGQVS
jgi:hypothetical protein